MDIFTWLEIRIIIAELRMYLEKEELTLISLFSSSAALYPIVPGFDTQKTTTTTKTTTKAAQTTAITSATRASSTSASSSITQTTSTP